VDHHHHVRPFVQGIPIARLLVAAVPRVLLVGDDRQPHPPGDLDGPILTAIIDEQDFVDAPRREVADRGGQRLLGVVRRQDGDDLVLTGLPAGGGPQHRLDGEGVPGRVERRAGEELIGHRKVTR
jgi:hypothetical protein